jgi:hypothetical protein
MPNMVGTLKNDLFESGMMLSRSRWTDVAEICRDMDLDATWIQI